MYKYKECLPIPNLSFVDDILAIGNCGSDSIKLNAIVQSKMATKKLEMGYDKCFQIHVGSNSSKVCPKLSVHDEEMKESIKEKYLGDIVHSSGNIRHTMVNMSEKYSVKWMEFQTRVCRSFQDLRNNQDFCDVTLACDDDQQIEAHKVILSGCSPVFKKLLKNNPHQHPLIYLRGIKYRDLVNVREFIYQGEVSIDQRYLQDFISDHV